MKLLRNIILSSIGTGLFLTGCATSSALNFADGNWSVDKKRECVADAGSGYIFPLSGRCDSNTTVIYNHAGLQGYHHLDKYLSYLKEKAGLADAQVLVYVPQSNTLWLKLPGNYKYERPKSITTNLDTERPYTMWVHPNETEQWNRSPEEMYTYTYSDKRKKCLCIVDVFNYGNTPIARMTILQTKTKRFHAIGLPADCSYPFTTTSIESIEMLSNWVDGHRNISIKNYKKGMEK